MRFRSYLLFLLILMVAPLASANVAPPYLSADPECFRQDFTEFLASLGRHPQFLPSDVAVAAQTVASLDAVSLSELEATLNSVPAWRAMPRVLVAVNAAEQAHRNELLSRVIQNAGNTSPPSEEQELQYFRRDFLFLLEQMGRFSDLMGPEFAARVDNVHRAIESMPDAALPALRDEYYSRADEWQLLAAGAPTARSIGANAMRPIQPLGCNWDCGIDVGCYISAIGCLIDEVARLAQELATAVQNLVNTIASVLGEVGEVFAAVINIPIEVGKVFIGLFGSIGSGLMEAFHALIDLIPDTIAEVVAFLEEQLGYAITNFDWNQIATQVPLIPDLCPDDAAAIAGEICDRGGDAITELVFNVVPEDGLSLAVKLGVAALHFPLAYLCQCKESQDALDFAQMQETERIWTGEHLDLELSTRATQASVNLLNTNLGDLDGDVASVEAKLDVLEAKVDTLAGLQNDAQLFVDGFRKLSTRLAIEENLLRVRPDVVSQYQLPRAFGGLLETVGLIVADTIRINLLADQPIGGAERELQRGDGLRLAGDFIKAFEAYRSAYSEAVKP